MIRMIITILLFSTGSVTAQLLRSGEHGDFTRLAFTDSRILEWSISELGQDVSIEFTPPVDLDLSEAFSRIDYSRIKHINFRENVLTITLGCNCRLDIKRVGQDQMAIDVYSINYYSKGDGPNLATLPPTTPQEIIATKRPTQQLPLLLEPLSVNLGSRFERLNQENIVGALLQSNKDETPYENNIPQIVLRDSRAADTKRLLASPIDEPANSTERCEGSERLLAVLEKNPTEAFESLPNLVAEIEVGNPSTIRSLIDAYFSSGLATEAYHLAESHNLADQWDTLLYASSQEHHGSIFVSSSSLCGPAASLLYLASIDVVSNISTSLQKEILSFAQSLPIEHRLHLVHHASENLRSHGNLLFADELGSWSIEGKESHPPDAILNYGSALADSIESNILNETAPPAELLNESEALVRELRNSEDQLTIKHSLLLNAVGRGETQESISILESVPAERRGDLLLDIAEYISQQNPARAIVLASAFSSFAEKMPEEGRKSIATVLRDSGFHIQATNWISDTSSLPSSDSTPSTRQQPPSLLRSQSTSQESLNTLNIDNRDDIGGTTYLEAQDRLIRSREVSASIKQLLEKSSSLN